MFLIMMIFHMKKEKTLAMFTLKQKYLFYDDVIQLWGYVAALPGWGLNLQGHCANPTIIIKNRAKARFLIFSCAF
jgi:hypothetical protein